MPSVIDTPRPLAEIAHKEETRGAASLEDHAAARANGGRGLDDPRRVSPGRLYVECLRFTRARAKGIRKSEMDTVAAEMMLRIGRRIEEETNKAAATPWRNRPPIPAGRILRYSDAGFFLRMDDGAELVSRDGRRILLATLKATLDNPSAWRETPAAEVLEDPHGATIAEIAVAETNPESVRVPDASAAELTAMLGLPLTAARVIEGALSYGRQNPRTGAFTISRGACCRDWGVTDETAKGIIKDGKRMIRARYPDPAALLAAMDAAADALTAVAEDALEDALEECRGIPCEGVPVREGRILHAAACRYWGAREEGREGEARTLSALMRNAATGSEPDALRPFRRDGLTVARMAHGARMRRYVAHARARAIGNAAAARVRREAMPYVPPTWGRTGAELAAIAGKPYPVKLTPLPALRTGPVSIPHGVKLTPSAAPTGAPVNGCHCEGCHVKRMRLAR